MLKTRVTTHKPSPLPLRTKLLVGATMLAAAAMMFRSVSAHAEDSARGYISPLPELELDFQPLYPQRVSPQVAREEAEARAEAERQRLAHEQALEEAKKRDMMRSAQMPFEAGSSSHASTNDQSRIAPLPTGLLGHGATVDSARDVIEPGVQQVQVPPIGGAQTLRLGKDTKQVLATLPSQMDTPPPVRKQPIALDRVSEDILEIVSPEEQYKDYEKAGIRISMHKGVLDSSRMLSKAYDALVAGDDATAIHTYKEIIGQEPKNEEALFGLAATYHRAGAYDMAKPVYEQLLKVNPAHREGLNNYLSLVAEYAPDDALEELEKLAARNPSFSPIHAQIGMLYSKLGSYGRAREKLLYAIQLSPHNLVYQYNLAVMLDKQGEIGDAVALYQKIVKAHGRGASVPADIDGIQRRLNFLVERYNRIAG